MPRGEKSMTSHLVAKRRSPGRSRNRLTRKQILKWADAHFARTGRWPGTLSGKVHDAPGESWVNIDCALKASMRGLKPRIHRTATGFETRRDSLTKLLNRLRGGATRQRMRTKLTEEEILKWAKDHRQRTGRWPDRRSGRVKASPENNWSGVDCALKSGGRGLPGRSSLAILLAQKCERRLIRALPRLSHGMILVWADAHHARTGRWPDRDSGPIPGVRDETWSTIYNAMIAGRRGLPIQSLAELFKRRRGVGEGGKSLLTEALILEWATEYHDRKGRWPVTRSGPIDSMPGSSWSSVDGALKKGLRGLPGKSSLRILLGSKRARPGTERVKPLLTVRTVMLWARAYARRYGRWPTKYAGRVEDARGETWLGIDQALSSDERGLIGQHSLKRLLAGRTLPAWMSRARR